MEVLLTIVTPIIVAIGIVSAFALSKRENKRKNQNLNRRDFVVRSTYTWGVIMSTIELLAVCLLIFGNIDGEFAVGVNIFLGVLSVAFGFGILQNFREKVRVIERKEIIYTPIFGKTKNYTFDHIDRVEKKKTGVYVYINGKKAFTLDPTGIGTSLFVELYLALRESNPFVSER